MAGMSQGARQHQRHDKAPRQRLPAITALLVLSAPATGDAHVKWFSKTVNCAVPPLQIDEVASSPLFLALLVLACLATALAGWVDERLWPAPSPRATAGPQPSATGDRVLAALLRGGVSLYFASAALYDVDAPFLLTPELHIASAWVRPLQLGIAVSALIPRGAWVATAGVVVLYANAIRAYGWFHMLDYLYFIGAAACLVMTARGRPSGARQGFMVLRALVALSFMWVGVEKWLYPAWTYDILRHQLPQLSLGMDHGLVVMAGGYVEFTLAFLIWCGAGSARLASVLLITLMVAAIPVAGPLDALGHSLLIAVLAALALQPNPWQGEARLASGRARLPGRFVIAMLAVIGLYELAHVGAYGGAGQGWPQVIAALLLPAPAGWRGWCAARTFIGSRPGQAEPSRGEN